MTDENPEEGNVYDIIVDKQGRSVKRNVTQELQQALKRVKNAGSKIPTEKTSSAPDSASGNCTGHASHPVPTEKQIPSTDDIYDDISDDITWKESPRSSISTYEEICDNNPSSKNAYNAEGSSNNDCIQLDHMPPESPSTKLQPHSMAGDMYTYLYQRPPTDDLDTAHPLTAYYVNQSEIWKPLKMA